MSDAALKQLLQSKNANLRISAAEILAMRNCEVPEVGKRDDLPKLKNTTLHPNRVTLDQL